MDSSYQLVSIQDFLAEPDGEILCVPLMFLIILIDRLHIL